MSVISEAEVGTEEYLRICRESRGQGEPDDPYVQLDSDPRWHRRQCWDGITRYVAGSGPSNDWIRHTYDPLDALKE
jgi:hypothetical protein